MRSLIQKCENQQTHINQNYNILMRRVINYQTENIQSQMSKQSQRNKSFPANKLSATFLKNSSHENCFPFNTNDYPFLNETNSQIKSYKTILNASLYANKIQKLISISHQNIVQLQKVCKSSGKSILGKDPQIHYSLFYEVVPYSLKAIAFSSKKQASHLPHLTSLEICQQLVEVTEYLMSIQVFYCVRLDDIGVSLGGEVKVFVSPNVLLNQVNKKIDRGDVMTSIDKVMGWWGTTISTKGEPISRKSQITGLSNSLGFTTDSTNTLANKKNSTSSFIIRNRQISEENVEIQKATEMHKPGIRPKSPITNEKMKKIDEEIKLMRSIMQEKVKNRIRKESADAVAEQTKETNKLKFINNKSFESVKLSRPEVAEQTKNQQSIQQNINCINIYNNTQSAEKAAKPLKKSKKMQAKPMYSYTIKPNNDIQLEYKKLNQYKVNNNNFSPQDQIYQQDDNLSVDTYQMDLGSDFQPISPINTPVKQLLFVDRQREKSEQNYKARKEDDKPKGQKKGNQVAVKKNVTQSAGPMQFKNFVVNFIKPQFLAKRSNIYEDPGEYESERSGSKHVSQHYHELNDAGKSATSHTQKSSSLGRKKLQNQQDYNRKYKLMPPQNSKMPKKKIQNSMKKACIISNVNDLSIPNSNRLIINQKSQGIICYRKLQDLQIGQKIKMALEKTKNAIALLNRVKLAKSPKHFESIHS